MKPKFIKSKFCGIITIIYYIACLEKTAHNFILLNRKKHVNIQNFIISMLMHVVPIKFLTPTSSFLKLKARIYIAHKKQTTYNFIIKNQKKHVNIQNFTINLITKRALPSIKFFTPSVSFLKPNQTIYIERKKKHVNMQNFIISILMHTVPIKFFIPEEVPISWLQVGNQE